MNISGMKREDVINKIDQTDRRAIKLSFPEECINQSPRYFADKIINNLLRQGLIGETEGRYFSMRRINQDKTWQNGGNYAIR